MFIRTALDSKESILLGVTFQKCNLKGISAETKKKDFALGFQLIKVKV